MPNAAPELIVQYQPMSVLSVSTWSSLYLCPHLLLSCAVVGVGPFSLSFRGVALKYAMQVVYSGGSGSRPLGTAVVGCSLCRRPASTNIQCFSEDLLIDVTPDELATCATSSSDALVDRKSTRLNSSHANISYAV